MAGTATLPGGESQIRLQLCSSEETKAYWPHDFCAEMTIIVGRTLEVSLKVTNTSSKSFEYTCALHSYYNLSAIDNIIIEGLQGTTYFNQLTGENGIQEEENLQIQEPITRHYLDTEAPVVIADSVFRRRIKAEKSGSKVTTVWNPGEETCAQIGDLPDDAFHEFVCVEATNAFGFPIKLAPGESHETSARIGLEE
jgi:glucose-6-phosphate 1-epimerase